MTPDEQTIIAITRENAALKLRCAHLDAEAEQFRSDAITARRENAELRNALREISEIGAKIIELGDGPSEVNACQENVAQYEAAVEAWRNFQIPAS